MDMAASQGDGCSGGHWNNNAGGCNVGAVGTECNDVGQGTEMVGEGNAAGRDCGAQHGHGFGHGAYSHSVK